MNTTDKVYGILINNGKNFTPYTYIEPIIKKEPQFNNGQIELVDVVKGHNTIVYGTDELTELNAKYLELLKEYNRNSIMPYKRMELSSITTSFAEAQKSSNTPTT